MSSHCLDYSLTRAGTLAFLSASLSFSHWLTSSLPNTSHSALLRARFSSSDKDIDNASLNLAMRSLLTLEFPKLLSPRTLLPQAYLALRK